MLPCPTLCCAVQLGKGVLVTGYQAVEIPHVSIGDGAIVEGSAFVEGHYIENMRFNYKSCRWVTGEGFMRVVNQPNAGGWAGHRGRSEPVRAAGGCWNCNRDQPL